MKRIARRLALGLGRLSARMRGHRSVILCYHSVHPTRSFRSATPAHFRDHLAWLAAHCNVVSLGDLWRERSRQPKNGRPSVAITFDDGYADNHEFVAPILLEHRMTATFFVASGYLDREPDVLARFMRERRVDRADVEPLTWDQLREIAASGMEIGAHTVTHPNLATLGPDALIREISGSKSVIEDRIGKAVTSFAYPYGRPGRHVSPAVVRQAEASGYELAVATCDRGVRRNDCAWRLPRFFGSNTSTESLASKIHGDWDLLGVIQETMPRWMQRRVSPDAEIV